MVDDGILRIVLSCDFLSSLSPARLNIDSIFYKERPLKREENITTSFVFRKTSVEHHLQYIPYAEAIGQKHDEPARSQVSRNLAL